MLPRSWNDSLLIQLYKGSGSRNQLKNHRFIHTKDEFPKFFGNLVMAAAKDTLVTNMSKFQIGAKPGHRSQEHLFVLKSVVSLYSTFDKALILSTWDISKYFDAENLSDVMNEIYKNEVRGKLYRLLYMMNQNTRIRVKTPVGITDAADTGEGLGQGTVEGALASSINLDNGVQDFFARNDGTVNDDEIYYLGLRLGPLLFQDDVARLTLDPTSAQRGNDRMESVAKTKLLNFNLEKSCFTIFGRKQRRQEMEKELEAKPLLLFGKNMTKERCIKYLGDILNEEGLAASVESTIAARKGIISRSIYDIRSIVDDCRSNVTGGLKSGLEMWELSVIPVLLNNAETWQDIRRKSLDDLEKLQITFLRCLLGVGTSCPIPLLLSETGSLLMEFRVMKKKLMFLHHLVNLSESSLAKEVLTLQIDNNLPGQKISYW